MEPARLARPDDDAELAAERARLQSQGGGAESLEKVLRFALPPKGADAPASAGPLTAREFAAAMDVVRAAADSVKAAEERARDTDARIQHIAQRAAEELKNAEARVQAAESRARAAEARAQDAETRARESDGWLRQIFTTISDELPVRRPA